MHHLTTIIESINNRMTRIALFIGNQHQTTFGSYTTFSKSSKDPLILFMKTKVTLTMSVCTCKEVLEEDIHSREKYFNYDVMTFSYFKSLNRFKEQLLYVQSEWTLCVHSERTLGAFEMSSIAAYLD